MSEKNKKILASLKLNKVIIPVLVGAVAVLVLFNINDEIDFDQVLIHIGQASLFWIFMVILALITRDAGYIYRIRHLTDKRLSWVSSWYVILLWEFASAVTPSIVGGTAVAVFIMTKENITFGKSLAFVIITAVLDNLFFIPSIHCRSTIYWHCCFSRYNKFWVYDYGIPTNHFCY